MKKIAPSILSADFSNLSQSIRYAEIGGADWIHCDIMDGHFVPNITFGPVVVKAVRNSTKLFIDAHLMIENPDDYIAEFVKAGADLITVHYEAVNHLNRSIQRIKELGVKAGVSINPATSFSNLSEILEFVDLLLIMSVNPGFGGQKFISNTLKKIKEADKFRKENNLTYLIQVDGGIGPDNIKEISEAGCDIFVAGSSIFNSENISASVVELKQLANSI